MILGCFEGVARFPEFHYLFCIYFEEAPQRPTIRVESLRESLEEGDILKLKCEAVDGEPEGKISWLKGEHHLTVSINHNNSAVR